METPAEDPKPTEPTPEPAAEPTPEPASEPVKEPTPEPVKEPSPEPEPEPVVKEEPKKGYEPRTNLCITKEALAGVKDVSADDAKKIFEPFNGDFLEAYDELIGFARAAGTSVEGPHVFFVGSAGAGKSSLLEAMLGLPFSSVSGECYCPTKRPVVVNVVFNQSCNFPRVTFAPDEREKEAVVIKKPENIPEEVSRRNLSGLSTPIKVTYETRYLVNMTLVDTPALQQSAATDTAVMEMIQGVSDARSRIVVAVDEVSEGPSPTVETLKSHGITGCRVVFTEAARHFKTLGSSAAITKFLLATKRACPDFCFVSLVPTHLAQGMSLDEFRLAIAKADAVTAASIKGLDRRLEGNVKIASFRKALLASVVSNFRQNLPAINRAQDGVIAGISSELEALEKQKESLATSKLHAYASTTGTTYYQFIQGLLRGTVDGILPAHCATFGQKLEEETDPLNAGPWPGAAVGETRAFSAVEWGVPDCGKRVLGKAQFERLLAEFQTVVGHTQMIPFAADEILCASGIHGPRKDGRTSARLVAVACELAQRRLETQVRPLVRHFAARVRYLLRRLAETAPELLVAVQKANSVKNGGGEPAERFLFFQAWLDDLYEEFFAGAVDEFRATCAEEFFDAEVLEWDFQSTRKNEVTAAAEMDSVEGVRHVGTVCFESARDRISRNIVLKCHNFFSDDALWRKLCGELNEKLDDDALPELFEVDAKRKKIEKRIEDVKKRIATAQEARSKIEQAGKRLVERAAD